jgi:UDP-N-acetylmuramoyl-L-alanyl-D-glutamate--2,6-diaminopimelate ligase
MQILADMETGLNTAAKRKYVSIPDRKQAIKTAVTMAQTEDIVLIAGKGHEKYQEINGVKHHFDDKEVLSEMFELLGK